MGFFKKITKGIGKVFKKIGKGIKSVVGKIGKFMGKLGIVGQIGLGLLLPGIGSMFGQLAGAMMGSGSAIISGAGQVLNAAVNIGSKIGSTFSSITEGVTKVIGDVAGAALNKIPGASDLVTKVTSNLGINSGAGIDISQKTFGSAWQTAQSAITDVAAKGGNLFSSGTLTDPNKYITTAAETAADLGASSLEAVTEDLSSQLTEQGVGPTITETTAIAPSPVDALQEIQVTAQRMPTALETQPSLLGRMGTAVKELPGRAADAAVNFVETAPQKIVGSVESAVQGSVEGKIYDAVGLGPKTPEVSYYSGYVPTIDMSGTTDIGSDSQYADASNYLASNTQSVNMSPYGFNANMFNTANYQQRMQQYGYAV